MPEPLEWHSNYVSLRLLIRNSPLAYENPSFSTAFASFPNLSLHSLYLTFFFLSLWARLVDAQTFEFNLFANRQTAKPDASPRLTGQLGKVGVGRVGRVARLAFARAVAVPKVIDLIRIWGMLNQKIYPPANLLAPICECASLSLPLFQSLSLSLCVWASSLHCFQIVFRRLLCRFSSLRHPFYCHWHFLLGFVSIGS